MFRKRTLAALILLLAAFNLTGCSTPGTGSSSKAPAAAFDGKEYIRESTITDAGMDPEAAAEDYEVKTNYDVFLSVPTYITEVDGTWFIVDCYHNRVIYSTELGAPLDTWKIMCDEVTQPHTMASDGLVYLIDDTENNRAFVYEKVGDKFIHTQTIDSVGNRPHFSLYDEISDTFYVWSSQNGELYCFRHTADSPRMYLTDVRRIEQLSNTYVRSFSIIDGDIYFVSGLSSDGSAPAILQCDLETLSVKKSYPVPDEIAGMVQLTKVDNMYYVTVSTDRSGNQDFATLLRTGSLDDLSRGKYEDIYSDYFIGGGTPYNISQADGRFFLTEHRLRDHQIWSFSIEKGQIKNVQAIY